MDHLKGDINECEQVSILFSCWLQHILINIQLLLIGKDLLFQTAGQIGNGLGSFI